MALAYVTSFIWWCIHRYSCIVQFSWILLTRFYILISRCAVVLSVNEGAFYLLCSVDFICMHFVRFSLELHPTNVHDVEPARIFRNPNNEFSEWNKKCMQKFEHSSNGQICIHKKSFHFYLTVEIQIVEIRCAIFN